jgi:hypothetical protein
MNESKGKVRKYGGITSRIAVRFYHLRRAMLQNRCLILVTLVFVEANRWVRFDEVEIDLVAEQLSDIGNAIPVAC